MRDDQGRLRAMLAVIDQGPGLLLWDRNDKEGAALINRESGTTLTLNDTQGHPRWRAP
jgi:hypothetical protein